MMLTEHDEPMPHLADDLQNIRRMAEERGESDPLAAMALDGCADEIEALRADLARAVGALEESEAIQTRVQQDTHWRSPDTSLWGDLCTNTRATRTTLASIKDKANG